MKHEDKIIAGILIAVAFAGIALSAKKYIATQRLVDKTYEVDTTPAVIQYDNSADYYLDWLFMMEKNFQETELGSIVGPDNLESYTVGADSTVQRKLDEALWGYCLRTSDLFGAMCSYMNEKRDYSDRMFDVLTAVVNSQETYLQKYASDLMKKDAKHNTFRHEAEYLTKVVNETLYKESKLLDWLNSKTK